MAVHDFKSQRLFLDSPMAEGDVLDLDREQANYLLNVLRMKNGDSILIFNGRDGERRSEIEILGRKKCRLIICEQTRSQPNQSRLIYCFAPLKQARLDYMVQKAVEMGAGVLQPVITQHTQVRTINPKRMSSNVVEAAEQCGILSVPEIRDPVSLSELPAMLPEGTFQIFCDEEANLTPLTGAEISPDAAISLLIGPEGGFSEEERQFLHTLENSHPLGLGPRILRADTAAVAALAIVQSTLGDWY